MGSRSEQKWRRSRQFLRVEKKIELSTGLSNWLDNFELPGKLENGWCRTFSQLPLRTALNFSGLFLRFDLTMQKKGGMTNDVKKGLVTALSVNIIGN